MESVLVAYSGGVDSTFLLKVCRDTLGDKVLAVTGFSAAYPKEELEFSKKVARRLGARHKIIKSHELKDKNFIANSFNRCYFCKKELFFKLKKIASSFKLKYVVDASNISDKKDFRPGDIAKRELRIRSPLQEAGLNKEEIRRLSRKMGLDTWNKPSLACLASRVPYGTRITSKILSRINKAERYLRKINFSQARVRHYNGLCRIEVFKKDIPLLINKRRQVVDRFKKLGYNYVTIDLEGYRSGSLNPALLKKEEFNISKEELGK